MASCDSSQDTKSCPHAEKSAELAASTAVRQVFAILGVNIDEPREVEEFRQNLRFGATMRRAADKGIMAVMGAIATGIVAAVWMSITTRGGH